MSDKNTHPFLMVAIFEEQTYFRFKYWLKNKNQNSAPLDKIKISTEDVIIKMSKKHQIILSYYEKDWQSEEVLLPLIKHAEDTVKLYQINSRNATEILSTKSTGVDHE